MSKFEEIKEVLKQKAEEKEGVFIYLKNVSNFQQKEIEFHN